MPKFDLMIQARSEGFAGLMSSRVSEGLPVNIPVMI